MSNQVNSSDIGSSKLICSDLKHFFQYQVGKGALKAVTYRVSGGHFPKHVQAEGKVKMGLEFEPFQLIYRDTRSATSHETMTTIGDVFSPRSFRELGANWSNETHERLSKRFMELYAEFEKDPGRFDYVKL